MKRNPYKTQDFVSSASTEFQVAADRALEGLARDPENRGFWWVKPLTQGEVLGVDLLIPSGKAILDAEGDLTKLSPTLIPEGGIVCPAGEFVMGSPPQEAHRYTDEEQRTVTIDQPFAIGKYPVTQDLYRAVTGRNPSAYAYMTNAGRCPVEQVSWYDAVRFCNTLSRLLGLDQVYEIGAGVKPKVVTDRTRDGFRLPMEDEWEYAARSGGDSFLYAGSNNANEVGWYAENSGYHTHPVGQKKPNRWGLYDMSGNVRVWLGDVYVRERKKGEDYTVERKWFVDRCVRGGCATSDRENMRVAARNSFRPTEKSGVIGFRLCRTLPGMKSNPRRTKK